MQQRMIIYPYTGYAFQANGDDAKDNKPKKKHIKYSSLSCMCTKNDDKKFSP